MSITIRILVPETGRPRGVPCRADDLADKPAFRERHRHIMQRHTAAIRWRCAYLQVAERLVAGASAARPVLAVSSACADAVFHVDAARLSRMAAAARTAGESNAMGAELAGRVLARILRGQGGELLTRWPGGPGWITALLGPPDQYQVGGTGPQASWALATAGAASVLALADRSAEQLAVIDPRTGVCAEDTVVPAGSLVTSGAPTKLPHCIVEFTAGTRSGAIAIPRSSRVILRCRALAVSVFVSFTGVRVRPRGCVAAHLASSRTLTAAAEL